MVPATDLKICSVAVAVFCAAFILWWSGSFDRATVMLAALCGCLAGYACCSRLSVYRSIDGANG